MRKSIMGFMLVITLVLAGCSSDSSIEKQLSTTIAKMNNAEKAYRDAQGELTELEKSEQELFSETMELTQEHRGELEIKVTELEELQRQRLAHIEGEEKSISKAKKVTGDLDAIIEQADGRVVKNIEGFKAAVMNRYELHSAFVAEYKKLSNLQRELYGMLVSDETKLTELEDKVREVNEQNVLVQSAVTSFNDATVKLNVLKNDTFFSLQKED